MRLTKLATVVIVLLTATACQKDDPNALGIINRNTPFSLQKEQDIDLSGSHLSLSVVSIKDSRCPTGMVCIWQGQALVAVKLMEGKLLAAEDTLCLGDCSQSAFTNTIGFTYRLTVYKLKLKEVNPFPGATQKATSHKAAFEWL